MSPTLTTRFIGQFGSKKSQQVRQGSKSSPLARFRSLSLGLARFRSLGCGGAEFLTPRHFRGVNTEKSRFSLNYEGFFTLPLTLLNKKS